MEPGISVLHVASSSCLQQVLQRDLCMVTVSCMFSPGNCMRSSCWIHSGLKQDMLPNMSQIMQFAVQGPTGMLLPVTNHQRCSKPEYQSIAPSWCANCFLQVAGGCRGVTATTYYPRGPYCSRSTCDGSHLLPQAYRESLSGVAVTSLGL